MQASIEQLLLDKNFSPVAIELWSNFVQHVLAMYWAAIDELLLPDRWEEFKNKKGALGTEKKLGGRVIKIPTEDGITTEIGGITNELFKALPLGHFLRENSVKFEFEVPVNGDRRAGRHSKKIDLRAIAMFSGAPSIAIEAKPIRTTSDIEKRYLGQEGIGCFFTDDSPYTTGKLGGMFAYTINATKDSMMESIDIAVRNYAPNKSNTGNIKVNDVKILWSHHDRGQYKLPSITILHLERVFPVHVLPATPKVDKQKSLAKTKTSKLAQSEKNSAVPSKMKKTIN